MQAAESGGPVLLPTDPENMRPARFPPTREASYLLPRANAATRMPLPMRRSGWGIGEVHALHRADAPPPEREESAAASRSLVYRVPDSREKAAAVDRFAALMYAGDGGETDGNSPDPDAVALPLPAPVPAWLSGPEETAASPYGQNVESSLLASLPETLEGSRERMASRLFGGLHAIQAEGARDSGKASAARPAETEPSVVVVFSVAGGVGKTSLVATLGRALSFAGTSVLLADTTPHGLLPFYYGAEEGQPGSMRSLQAPPGRPGVPVKLLTHVVDEGSSDAADALKAKLAREAAGASCLLIDAGSRKPSALASLVSPHTRVLVPLAPDMNSVISLGIAEALFAELAARHDAPLQPFYLLVGFDSAEALHLDVREVLRQQLGDRLLPFVIRRSSAVAEALAEGMTVVDFAPESAVASDYMVAAQWVCRKPVEIPLSRQGTLWNEH